MALAYKLHIQVGCDNTAPFPLNHLHINSCKLQLAEISTATIYVGMVMWEWCCVITATYFVSQCHFYASSFLYLILCVFSIIVAENS